MSELYDYILTVYKVVVGLVTTQRLILASLIAFGFYLVWVCAALLFSAQRKFHQRCNKLLSYIKRNPMDSTNLKVVDMKIERISTGFYHGWKKFKNSTGKKPSDFINRHDAVDAEVNGGLLNQGKTLMKAFINFVCAGLFIFNFAYLGNDAVITCYLVAETMILPFILFVVLKVFYFSYTSIKQQLYKADVESFYELVAVLDETFGQEEVVYQREVMTAPVAAEVQEDVSADEEKNEQTKAEENLEGEEASAEESAEEKEPEEDDPLKKLEKYDVFKKKNIDVDKILNEIPQTSQTSLPYINVDSDYVIKDDENVAASKIVHENETGSSLLGGMMQDRSSMKKANSSFIDVDKPVAEIDKEKLEELSHAEEKEDTKDDPFGGLEQFAVAENANIGSETKEEPAEEKEEQKEEKEETSDLEEKKEETPAVPEEPKVEVKPEEPETPVVPEEPEKDIAEIQRENIASVVSEFKSEKSRLASGGVVIERNEPIARRERPKAVEEFDNLEYEEPVAQVPVQEEYYPKTDEINKLNINENTDTILNSLKTSAGGYDAGYQGYNNGSYGQTGYGNQSYGYQAQNPTYVSPVDPYANSYMNQQQTSYGGYQSAGYVQNPYDTMSQAGYDQNFDAFNQETEYSDYQEEETIEEAPESKPVKKTVKRTKENEPRPRNLRSKGNEKMSEPVAETTKTRGRPKKQEVSETMTIKNDKEFDEVLSRAEKLMRKSDEGLSASQSKRVEKELKMLMDAMNRYKESK